MYIEREQFTAGDTRLLVRDWVDIFHPSRSKRLLWIEGTNALYSAVPLFSSSHKLLCYNYCDNAMKMREPSFFHNALVLGCGGGAIPRWLLQEYPDIAVDVVDFSPEVISVCKKYFLRRWKNSDRLKFSCVDAQDYEQPEYKYQFIFCDLFDGEDFAPFVCTAEFVQKLRGMISDEGLLAINCEWGNLQEVLKAYQDDFKQLQIVKRDSWQTQAVIAQP